MTRTARAPRTVSLGPRAPVPVPPPGPGVCTRCHGPARLGPGECWCCRRVGLALGEAPGAGPPVAVVALCRPGDVLHALLRRYKDGPVVEARRHHAAVLGHLLDRFVAGLDLAVDGVVAVPSSTRPAVGGIPPCPLDAVLDASRILGRLPRLRLRRGPAPIGHLRASPDAFEVPGPVAGSRVLVVEDTWVTGARARSAADALRRAGATVVALLVIGRAVDPAAAPELAAWWARATAGRTP